MKGHNTCNPILRAIAAVLFLLAGVPAAMAQKDGGIPNAEIEIVKDKKVTLPAADRNFQKIAPRPAEPVRHDIVYDFRNLKFNTADFSPVIRPLKLKQEDIAKIYGNYLSAGFGNYTSPYLEAFLNSRRDKNQFYGLHFYHRSFGSGPVDKKNSASSNSEVKLFGKSMGDDVTLSGDLGFQNRNSYFYGYGPGPVPERGSILQTYNNYSLAVALENTKSGDLNYKIYSGIGYLTDVFQTTESDITLGGKVSYSVSDKSKIVVNLDYSRIGRKDSLTHYKARNLFKLQPAYQFRPIENLTFSAGANVAIEDDGGSKVHVYPNLRADYTLAETVTLFASLSGDIDKVTLHTLSRDNVWLGSNLAIAHTDRKAELTGGLKGKMLGKIAFLAGVSFANLENLYSFRNIEFNEGKFEVTYNKTSRFNMFGELGFNPGENLKMALRADVFSYTTQAVYNRPRYRVVYTSSYNIFDKIWLSADLIAQGGMKARSFVTIGPTTLPAAFDLNAKADYFFSRRASVFVKFNNILSSNYQLYLNYPVRGLQVMGGATFTF